MSETASRTPGLPVGVLAKDVAKRAFSCGFSNASALAVQCALFDDVKLAVAPIESGTADAVGGQHGEVQCEARIVGILKAQKASPMKRSGQLQSFGIDAVRAAPVHREGAFMVEDQLVQAIAIEVGGGHARGAYGGDLLGLAIDELKHSAVNIVRGTEHNMGLPASVPGDRIDDGAIFAARKCSRDTMPLPILRGGATFRFIGEGGVL